MSNSTPSSLRIIVSTAPIFRSSCSVSSLLHETTDMLTSLSFEEVVDDRIGERLDALHQRFIDRSPSLNEIFNRLYKTLSTRDQLIDEYHQLSKNIQNVISNCAQCIHERYKYENDLVLIKDRICQSLGQVGLIQDSLEHYRTIIESLENETERLENLLSHPQIAQVNQQKFQIFEQNQRVHLDRLIKENEQVRKLIHKEKESIVALKRDIERDKDELEKLQISLGQTRSEGEQISQQRSEVAKRTEHLRATANQMQQMENEFHQRLKLTKDQYRLAQKQYQSLINTQQTTNEQLSKLTTRAKEVSFIGRLLRTIVCVCPSGQHTNRNREKPNCRRFLSRP